MRWFFHRLASDLPSCLSFSMIVSSLFPHWCVLLKAENGGTLITDAFIMTSLRSMTGVMGWWNMFFFTLPQTLNIEGTIINNPQVPPATWPSEGAITFKHYKMRYSDSHSPVIKGITLNIQAREKIGIVGKSGSGIYFCMIIFSLPNSLSLFVSSKWCCCCLWAFELNILGN